MPREPVGSGMGHRQSGGDRGRSKISHKTETLGAWAAAPARDHRDSRERLVAARPTGCWEGHRGLVRLLLKVLAGRPCRKVGDYGWRVDYGARGGAAVRGQEFRGWSANIGPQGQFTNCAGCRVAGRHHRQSQQSYHSWELH